MRLLLVEDDTMIGEAVRDLLRAEHYAVDWATDGDMADAALAAQSYDLVLLDLGLPRRDGLAVLRSLRARKDRTPVLIATDGHHVAAARLLMERGADVNAQDAQRDSAFLLAGARGYTESIAARYHRQALDALDAAGSGTAALAELRALAERLLDRKF